MNCKQGDLAMIVCSTFGMNVGKIVRVLSYYGRASFKVTGTHDDCWLIEASGITTTSGAPFCSKSRRLGADGCMPDAWLRPIRPQADDAQDESVRWLPPVPHTTKETA